MLLWNLKHRDLSASSTLPAGMSMLRREKKGARSCFRTCFQTLSIKGGCGGNLSFVFCVGNIKKSWNNRSNRFHLSSQVLGRMNSLECLNHITVTPVVNGRYLLIDKAWNCPICRVKTQRKIFGFVRKENLIPSHYISLL